MNAKDDLLEELKPEAPIIAPTTGTDMSMKRLDMLLSDLMSDTESLEPSPELKEWNNGDPKSGERWSSQRPSSKSSKSVNPPNTSKKSPSGIGSRANSSSAASGIVGGKNLDSLMGELDKLAVDNSSQASSHSALSPYKPAHDVLTPQQKNALHINAHSDQSKHRGSPSQLSPSPSLPGATPPSTLLRPKSALPTPIKKEYTPNICASCEKPIVGPFVTALSKTWHLDHLCCTICHKPLANDTFYENEGKLYCQKHHLDLVAPKCAYCDKPIAERCINALGKSFHAEHFFCSQCGKLFEDGGFMEHEGKAYCEEDYFNLFAPKCGRCQKPVLADTINALDKTWHPACFVCLECEAPFTTGTFFSHDNQPLCELHYHTFKGSLCPSCCKPITGKCVIAMNKRWHPDHFACSFCKKQLGKIPFKENEDKPYCIPCHTKIYG